MLALFSMGCMVYGISAEQTNKARCLLRKTVKHHIIYEDVEDIGILQFRPLLKKRSFREAIIGWGLALPRQQ